MMDESFVTSLKGSPRSKLRHLQENLTITDTPYALRKQNNPDKSVLQQSLVAQDSASTDTGKNNSTIIPDLTIGNLSVLNETSASEDSILEAKRNVIARRKFQQIKRVAVDVDDVSINIPTSEFIKINKTYDELGISLGDSLDSSLDISLVKKNIEKKRKRKGITDPNVDLLKKVQYFEDNAAGDKESDSSIEDYRQAVIKSRAKKSRKSVNFSIPVISIESPNNKDTDNLEGNSSGSSKDNDSGKRSNFLDALALTSKIPESNSPNENELKVSLERIPDLDTLSKSTKGLDGVVSLSFENDSDTFDPTSINVNLQESADRFMKTKRKSVTFSLDSVISEMRKTRTNNQKVDDEPVQEIYDSPKRQHESRNSSDKQAARTTRSSLQTSFQSVSEPSRQLATDSQVISEGTPRKLPASPTESLRSSAATSVSPSASPINLSESEKLRETRESSLKSPGKFLTKSASDIPDTNIDNTILSLPYGNDSDEFDSTIDNSLHTGSSKTGNLFSQKRKSVNLNLDDVISKMRKENTDEAVHEINKSHKFPLRESRNKSSEMKIDVTTRMSSVASENLSDKSAETSRFVETSEASARNLRVSPRKAVESPTSLDTHTKSPVKIIYSSGETTDKSIAESPTHISFKSPRQSLTSPAETSTLPTASPQSMLLESRELEASLILKSRLRVSQSRIDDSRKLSSGPTKDEERTLSSSPTKDEERTLLRSPSRKEHNDTQIESEKSYNESKQRISPRNKEVQINSPGSDHNTVPEQSSDQILGMRLTRSSPRKIVVDGQKEFSDVSLNETVETNPSKVSRRSPIKEAETDEILLKEITTNLNKPPIASPSKLTAPSKLLEVTLRKSVEVNLSESFGKSPQKFVGTSKRKSVEVSPSKLTEASPRKSTEASPRKSTEASPRKSTEASPRKSTEASPRKSTEANLRNSKASPRNSAGASPRKSVGASMRKSTLASPKLAGTSPRKSAGASPKKLAGTSPRKSAGASPSKLTGKNQRKSTEASPRKSTEASPRKSTEASPRNSTKANLRNSKASPRNSAGASPRKSAGASMRKSTGASPKKLAGTSPRKSAGASPKKLAGTSPRKSAGASPRKSTGPSLRKSLRTSPMKSVGASPRKSFGKSPRKSVVSIPSTLIESSDDHDQTIMSDKQRRNLSQQSLSEAIESPATRAKILNEKSPVKSLSFLEASRKSPRINSTSSEDRMRISPEKNSLTVVEDMKSQSLPPEKFSVGSKTRHPKEMKSKSLSRKVSDISVVSDTSSNSLESIQEVHSKRNLVTRQRQSVDLNFNDIIEAMQVAPEKKLLSPGESTAKQLYGSLTKLIISPRGESSVGTSNLEQVEETSKETNESDLEIPFNETLKTYSLRRSPGKSTTSPGRGRKSPQSQERKSLEKQKDITSVSSSTQQLSTQDIENLKKSIGNAVQSSVLGSNQNFIMSSLQNFISNTLMKSIPSQPSEENEALTEPEENEALTEPEENEALTEPEENEALKEPEENEALTEPFTENLSIGSHKSTEPYEPSEKEIGGPELMNENDAIYVESQLKNNSTDIVSVEDSGQKHVETADDSRSVLKATLSKKSLSLNSSQNISKHSISQVTDRSHSALESSGSRARVSSPRKRSASRSKHGEITSKSKIFVASNKDDEPSTSKNKDSSKASTSKGNVSYGASPIRISTVEAFASKATCIGETSASQAASSKSGGAKQLTLKEFLEKMSKNELPRAKEPNYLAEMLKKPEILLKLSPKKPASVRKPRQKKTQTKLMKNLPLKMNSQVFQHFFKHKLTKEGAKAVHEATESFFENLSSDLAVIMASKKDKVINKDHVYLLLKELKIVDCWEGLYAMLQELLPADEWKKVVPIRYAFNQVYPKEKK